MRPLIERSDFGSYAVPVRARRPLAVIPIACALLVLALPNVALAAVTISKAEVSGSRLRMEGRAAANRTITVDGVAMGTSDGAGNFRIERDNFTAPTDCTVDVNDGSATPTSARLSGCTVTSPEPPPEPPPPTTEFRIVTGSLPNANVGTNYTGFIEAAGGDGGPIRWSLVAGRVPNGMSFAGDSLRLTQTTAVLGTPTTVQTATFTVEARDQAGNTTRKSFSLTVDPPRPLVITNGTDTLHAGTVGQSYANGLFADGGVQPYRWSVIAGQLPPGLQVTSSPGRISGTPTTAGTFTFTVRVADSGGQTASQQFSITINP